MTIIFKISGFTSYGKPSCSEETLATIPTKSAFVGTIAAALGYNMHEHGHQQRLKALYENISFAVQVHRKGRVERDFQTARNTIRSNGKLNKQAVLLDNEYINDTVCFAAIQCNSKDLEKEIAIAILKPRYTLYFGKRSCLVNSEFYNFTLKDCDLMDAFDSDGTIYSDVTSEVAYKMRVQERITNTRHAYGNRVVYVSERIGSANESV